MLLKTGRNRALCLTGGVCKAKLGAQCVLRCPIEKRKRRKAVAAANAAANAAAVEAAARAASSAAQGMLVSQVSLRESVSSASGSLDDDLDISQEPTGAQSSTPCMCIKCLRELSGQSPNYDTKSLICQAQTAMQQQAGCST